MRRIVAGCLIVVAGLAVVVTGAAGSGTPAKVTVKPRTGGPRTRFVVRFRAGARTGVIGIVDRRYQVEVSGKGTGCAQSAATDVPPTHKGQLVSVKLSGPWCVATYHGKLTWVEGPYCRAGQPCPEFATQVRTIARFTFVVTKSGDITPPSFAGLNSAVQCFPGPQRPGEQRPVGLSWNAASDNQTPSSQITYEIYMASTAGGEDFSQPSWTTVGATTFLTPSLPPGRFFVVRSRDQADNEDHNAVERQAENPCL
jgi:hypothetical protein